MHDQPTPTLFDSMTTIDKVLAPTAGRVHHGDPITARQAAEKVSLRSGTQKAKVLIILAQLGDAIPHQLHAEAGCATAHVAHTRLMDLADLGLVVMTPARRDTPHGGKSHVWKVTDQGRQVAAELAERAAA